MTEQLTRTEVLAPEPAEALAALLDIDPPADELLPPLWHWLHLLPRPRTADLSPDGHPITGIPAPPGPGRRRMFAGGRITTLRPLRLGVPATRVTEVVDVREKQGRSGPLTFATVRSTISQADRPGVVEEQDIVYRAPGGAALPAEDPEPSKESWPGPRLELGVDEALLFRFSALTFNAHRIHYDLGWAAHEGYAGLVVHGPLQTLLMAELLRREGIDLVGHTFTHRLLAPLVGVPRPLVAAAGTDGLAAGVRAGDGADLVSAVASRSTPG
ncbi:mesaconyl-C4 CoA hydratase [Enemella evansiae]|uniref:Mesaconyl-C4 CoA hydratase n=1 Tax=Enemella evansiae TaxID=2016499 RepID=A0A255GES4_9ACTN|nr:MaoC family dehydratase N-terminal domain-containing protein [Enemella evansiae]OYO14340.1 mesaconyl-C4 CoA hydratase [Enemella evansiae]